MNLSSWSKDVVYNVFDHVKEWKSKIKYLKEEDFRNPSETSREELNKGQAEYYRWMNLQDGILKQKAQVRWIEEGDSNTKYFHGVIKDKRRKVQLHMIKNHKDGWVQGDDKIAKAAVHHFKKIV